MLAKTILPVLAAVGVQLASGMASQPVPAQERDGGDDQWANMASPRVAQTNDPCTATTFTINSQADAAAFLSCQTLKGDVVVGTNTDVSIRLDGPQAITGSLKVANNGGIQTLASSTIQNIGGTFDLNNVTFLTTLSFTSLTSVGAISWQHLTHLTTLTLGSTGITKADNVLVTDTFLDSLTGLNVVNVKKIDINNNVRLVSLTSALQTVSDQMLFQANGVNLQVAFPSLVWCLNMTIQDVGGFDLPALKVINGSARFNENQFTSFFAPNLTQTTSGDISFVSNGALTNISMPSLKSIAGGFTIANNTLLAKIDGFNSLTTVGGAVKLRGNFTE